MTVFRKLVVRAARESSLRPFVPPSNSLLSAIKIISLFVQRVVSKVIPPHPGTYPTAVPRTFFPPGLPAGSAVPSPSPASTLSSSGFFPASFDPPSLRPPFSLRRHRGAPIFSDAPPLRSAPYHLSSPSPLIKAPTPQSSRPSDFLQHRACSLELRLSPEPDFSDSRLALPPGPRTRFRRSAARSPPLPLRSDPPLTRGLSSPPAREYSFPAGRPGVRLPLFCDTLSSSSYKVFFFFFNHVTPANVSINRNSPPGLFRIAVPVAQPPRPSRRPRFTRAASFFWPPRPLLAFPPLYGYLPRQRVTSLPAFPFLIRHLPPVGPLRVPLASYPTPQIGSEHGGAGPFRHGNFSLGFQTGLLPGCPSYSY